MTPASIFKPGYKAALLLLPIFLQSPTLSHGAVDTFLEIEGIQGESIETGHEGQIDVLDWSWGMSNSGSQSLSDTAGSGKVAMQDIHITKRVDRSSPPLIEALCSGVYITQATLTVTKLADHPLHWKVITLTDVLVTSYETAGSNDQNDARDSFTLNFDKVKVDYQPIDPSGQPQGDLIRFLWDILLNLGTVYTTPGNTGTPVFTPTKKPNPEATFTPTPTERGNPESTPTPTQGGVIDFTPTPTQGGILDLTPTPTERGASDLTPTPTVKGNSDLTPTPTQGGILDLTPTPTEKGASDLTPTPTGKENSDRTPTPTVTPISTPTREIPTTPTPTIRRRWYIEVYDNVGVIDNPAKELTGKTDYDPAEIRSLAILCTAEPLDAVDWHFYVRRGLGGFKFLGRSGDGATPMLIWSPKTNKLAKEFAKGPDFNSVYSFRAVRIYNGKKSGPSDIFTMDGLVGYNIDGGNPIKLTLPEMPYLKDQRVCLSDDLLGLDEIAPPNGTGVDTDSPDSQAIQIAWNFDADPTQVSDYHVQVSVDGGKFEFLGQTYSGKITYFWWTPNFEFQTAANFANGPQNGKTYQFRVFMKTFDGKSTMMESGRLTYSVSP